MGHRGVSEYDLLRSHRYYFELAAKPRCPSVESDLYRGDQPGFTGVHGWRAVAIGKCILQQYKVVEPQSAASQAGASQKLEAHSGGMKDSETLGRKEQEEGAVTGSKPS